MDFEYQSLLPNDFNDSSKVWIYQSNRIFTLGEALQVEELLETFVEHWKSHGAPVKGYANLLFGQFVVFIADETATGVSGCSTDSSVRVVKQLEEIFKVNLLDRLNLAFVIKEKLQTIPLAQFKYAVENNFIDASTLYFNNMVLSLKELKENWMIPVKQSWLKSKIPALL